MPSTCPRALDRRVRADLKVSAGNRADPASTHESAARFRYSTIFPQRRHMAVLSPFDRLLQPGTANVDEAAEVLDHPESPFTPYGSVKRRLLTNESKRLLFSRFGPTADNRSDCRDSHSRTSHLKWTGSRHCLRDLRVDAEGTTSSVSPFDTADFKISSRCHSQPV